MRKPYPRLLSLVALLLLTLSPAAFAQKEKKNQPPAAPLPVLSRKTSRHEVRRLGYGGSLNLVGAPLGTISIEAWSKSEIDITADIEINATSEEDLTKLAAFDDFIIDASPNSVHIMTTGTHDRVFMKRVAKNFPKNLLGIPFRIDYKLKVPANIDIDIDAGQGDFTLAGVEGAISLRAVSGNVKMDLVGGFVRAVVGAGNVDINVAMRSWRGEGIDVQLAAGTMTVMLPAGFNADINAAVLRTGRIDNQYPGLSPREDTQASDHLLSGRAGSGGATLSFKVTDGNLIFRKPAD